MFFMTLAASSCRCLYPWRALRKVLHRWLHMLLHWGLRVRCIEPITRRALPVVRLHLRRLRSGRVLPHTRLFLVELPLHLSMLLCAWHVMLHTLLRIARLPLGLRMLLCAWHVMLRMLLRMARLSLGLRMLRAGQACPVRAWRARDMCLRTGARECRRPGRGCERWGAMVD